MKRRVNAALAAVLWFWLAVPWALADKTTVSSSSVLLTNVNLAGQDGSPDRRVNIRIRDQRLDIISEDQIPVEAQDEVYEGRGGYIVGHLLLDEPANFMLLDGDPRSNFQILLDTKVYGIFAMKNGEVVRNRLIRTIDDPRGRAVSEAGWLAYSPPPLAVPMDYRNRDKWNRFDTPAVSGILTGALALDRAYWTDQDDTSIGQVGDLTPFDGGQIRALRFGSIGTINFDRPWIYTFFAATHAYDQGYDSATDDDFTILDLRLDIPLTRKSNLSLGKLKEPISMSRLSSLLYVPQQERGAMLDALLPSRNVGAVFSGTAFDDNLTWAAGAFNNWIDRDQPSSFSDNATQFTGRLTGVAWHSEDDSALLHIGGGLRYTDAKEGVRIKARPEVNRSPNYIDTDTFFPDSALTYQAEASFRTGPWWLHSEYVRADIDSTELGNPVSQGYSVTLSWVATGEMRGYNKRNGIFKRVPIARTVDQNGIGAWEYSVRYSSLDANDGKLDAGKMDILSAGVNWWLSPYLSFNVNYRHVTLDQYGDSGTSQAVVSRIMLILE